jgi:predicted P-loop ATPase
MQQFWAQMHSYWAAGEQWWLTPGEEKLQADSNERFQAADGIVDMVQMEIEKREARDTYTQECSLNATGVLMVIQQRAEDRALRRRAKAACIKLIGPPADYRKRDGTAESWVFWLTATEAKSLGVKRLRPSKV